MAFDAPTFLDATYTGRKPSVRQAASMVLIGTGNLRQATFAVVV